MIIQVDKIIHINRFLPKSFFKTFPSFLHFCIPPGKSFNNTLPAPSCRRSIMPLRLILRDCQCFFPLKRAIRQSDANRTNLYLVYKNINTRKTYQSTAKSHYFLFFLMYIVSPLSLLSCDVQRFFPADRFQIRAKKKSVEIPTDCLPAKCRIGFFCQYSGVGHSDITRFP